MARKLRLEFPGAIYHVINRGNYRSWVFKDEGAKRAFEKCLFEACTRSGWLLHAYVVMGNHYHLALETPKGNLVNGMQWLQSTFANRFNKLRGERGHLFQGRYKSILVEAGPSLGMVCDYIHLNPVRAEIVPVERLKEYRCSSYWYLRRPKERPKFLEVQTALIEAGGLVDKPAGWQCYDQYLAWQAQEGPLGKTSAYVSLSKGWALGSREFKQALHKDHELAIDLRAWDSTGLREVKNLHWQKALASAVKQVPEKAGMAKSAAWKIAVAAHLKATADVPNAWLAEKLEMGSGFYVNKHVGHLRKNPDHPAHRVLKQIQKATKVKGTA